MFKNGLPRDCAALVLCAAFAFGMAACSNSSDNSAALLALAGTGSGGTQDPVFTPVYETLGSWPQTVKVDSVTVNESETKTAGAFTYCKGSDGQWYAKIKENACGSGYKYSDGTTVARSSANSYKWFKVEPIKWLVLTTNYNGTGKKLLLSEKILANCAYYDYYNVNRTVSEATVYPNNYEHSKVRAFLNGISYQKKDSDSVEQAACDDFLNKGFLQSAFTAEELAKIVETTVDNSADSTTASGDNFIKDASYACANTSDKVFLLSAREATNGEYGFLAYYRDDTGNARIRPTTDYVKASGAYQTPKEGPGGWWWLRSPVADGRYARNVGDYGRANDSTSVSITYYGVVPALCVSN